MRVLLAWIQEHAAPLLLVNSALLLVLLALLVYLALSLARLSRRYRELLAHEGSGDLHDLLQEALAKSREAASASEATTDFTRLLDEQLSQCLQRVGLVRFDAYESVGGQLSFSVALLNRAGDGVVMTSLYGRQDCRVYARSVEGGRCEGPLTEEEQAALEQALGGASPAAAR